MDWREPTETRGGRVRGMWADYAAALQLLTENPGRWAVVATRDTRAQAQGTAGWIKGRYATSPYVGFEATARKAEDDHHYEVFARYVGDDK